MLISNWQDLYEDAPWGAVVQQGPVNLVGIELNLHVYSQGVQLFSTGLKHQEEEIN